MIFSVIMLIKNHSRKKSHDTDVSQRKKRKRTFESLPESVYCATSKRKIIVPGGAAGLQIRLGPPAVPGRFDSCDLPPKFLHRHPRTSKKPLFSKKMVNHSSVTVRQVLPESMKNMYSDVYRFFIRIFDLYTWHLQTFKSNEQSLKTSQTKPNTLNDR